MPLDQAAFNMRRVFVKDLSFECPAAAEPRPVDSKVIMDVTVGAEHRQRDYDGLWDVTLAMTLHAYDEGSGATHFISEAKLGALFEISGYPDGERERLLTTRCREAVYPFLRTLFWSVGNQAGLRGMLLRAMDFDELYQRATQTGVQASGVVKS